MRFWRRRDDTPECRHCGAAATFRSKVSGDWLCDACNPCWCHWCNGRVGVHGPEAVALYKQEVAAYATLPPSLPDDPHRSRT